MEKLMIVSPRVMRGNRSIRSGLLAVAAVLCLVAGSASAAPSNEAAANGAAATSGANSTSELSADSAVTAIRIEPLGATENAIIGELSKPTGVTLKKTAPSEYVLSLENATLAEAAAATLVAPPSAGTIRSVRPLTDAKSATFRIFAAPTVDLKAEVRGNQFVVKAATTSLDERAQMDPNGAPAPAADAAAKPASADEVTISGPEAPTQEMDAEVAALLSEQPKYSGRLISLDLQDTDIDNALRIIAEVSNLNIIASEDVAGKVTLRLIDVPWDQALDVILKTNALDKVQEGNVVRIAPVEKLRLEREALKQSQQAEDDLEPLSVKYIRVSYAKAAELKPLIDTVISERGSVSYDERTNQLIVKDIRKGLKNVVELVSKLDLRTPQILIETQIVEAKRDFSRELGAELGFQSIQSPETGNATSRNFPNSINIVGSTDDKGTFSSFPAASGAAGISFLLGSADGSLSLNTRLSALENEGRGRVVSRPSVATTNNKQAVIKSVEKVRIKTPSGGVSVATGSGASASGTSAVATEVIEVGIVLEVTPQASPDYFVLLDINAKSSTLGVARVDGIPGEIERSATSTVLVSSGQTFAMGGIYKIDDSTSVEGVPFFKDIPFIGHFFRSQLVDNGDEELLFFLTPRIVEGSFDDAAMKVNS
jgi:type IV pilus secretin PilQ/predicted competence protein